MFLRKFLWYFLYLCWDEPDVAVPINGDAEHGALRRNPIRN